jgi:hypothetical protein
MAAGKANENNKDNQKGKTLTDDWFDAFNPNKMISNAQKVLSSAVNVLEEEIAAGILAAKKIEKKVINVDDISNDPEDLMNRIRRDSHEALDLLLDALSAITKQLGIISGTMAKEVEKVKDTAPLQTARQENSVPVVEADQPLKPGKSAILYVSLSDENAKENITIQLQKTDLNGPLKQKISARYIQVKPASAVIKPGGEKEFAIHIKLPKNCKPGRYSALLYDARNPLIRAVIGIEVA